jgi:hypothetical protein
MLNPDFKNMLSYLRDEKVDFIVVDAYALAAHGFPRATGEIDIWVRSDAENAQKVMRALAKFGASLSDISANDLAVPDSVLQLGVELSRIDLLTSIDGVEFDEAWAEKINITIDELEIHVLSKGHLIRNKLAAGRDKDQGDIVWLEKHQDEKS